MGLGRVDSLLAGLPVSRANFTVLFDELEGLEYSEGLFGRSANREVIDSRVSEDTVGVDQEETSSGDSTGGV